MIPIKPPPRVARILRDAGSPDEMTPALERSTLRELVGMGLPSTLSFLLLSLYDVADVFWLAKLGEAPVAAVTVFSAFFWLLAFANGIIGSGSVAVISRRFGERNLAGTEGAIKNTFFGKAAIGVVFGAIGIGLLPHAMRILGATPEVVALGQRYGVLQCVILPFPLVSFSVYTAFRGIGRPGLGALISLAGAIVNIVLDPLLIFGIGPFPRLDILGASIASALGFVTVVGWGAVALASPRSPVRVRWLSAPYPNVGETWRMAKVGLPSGVSSMSFALFANALVKLVAEYGTVAVALFGMSQKILRFGNTVVAGLGLGSSALIGQHLGAGRLDRAWVCAVMTMRVASGTLLLFAAIVFVGADVLARFFFPDPALAVPGAAYLRILAPGLPFLGLIAGAEHAYSGAGRNLPPMILHLTEAWIITIPIMLALGKLAGLGPVGTIAGVALGQFVGGGIAVWLVRRGSWLTHRV